MLTFLGGGLVVTGAAGLGICLCRERRMRVKELLLIERFLILAAGEIAYAQTGMPGVLYETGERFGGRFGSALMNAGCRLQDEKGMTLERIWQEEMTFYLQKSCLKKEERDLLLSFPGQLGFSDGKRQQNAIEKMALETGSRVQCMQQQLHSLEKMTMALCLSGGIVTAILFL